MSPLPLETALRLAGTQIGQSLAGWVSKNDVQKSSCSGSSRSQSNEQIGRQLDATPLGGIQHGLPIGTRDAISLIPLLNTEVRTTRVGR